MSSARTYIALDIETSTPFPQNVDWRTHRPLGVACAVMDSPGWRTPQVWHSWNPDGTIAERMTRKDLQRLVRALQYNTRPERGQTIATWNGAGFDFDVLAEESGLKDECRNIALSHVDLMLHIMVHTGYPVSLAAAADGMGLPGKSDGMSGEIAAALWQENDRDKVVQYCAQDSRTTLEAANAAEQMGEIRWTSRSGRAMSLPMDPGWLTVREAIGIPEPDTSWMSGPILRSTFTGWLDEKP